MTKTQNIALYILSAALVFATLFSGVQFAHANPSFFSVVTATSGTAKNPDGNVATTTSYMAAGFATTTLARDMYDTSLNAKADKAIIFMQFVSTTTIGAPSLKVRVEYSYDNVEWYPQSAPITTAASTTQMTGNFADYQFTLSTTSAQTQGLGGTSQLSVSAGTATTTLSLLIDTPARYVRLVYTIPIGGGRGSLFAGIQPWKERQ